MRGRVILEVFKIRSDILRGHVDSIILRILMDGDSYGYEISKEISDRTREKFQIKEATLYAVFQRLEKKGFIKSYYGDRSHGGKRKYYTITARGKMYLDEMIVEWKEIKEIMAVFLEESAN
ncbi:MULTISPECIES: PadR family transcriptional regulator [Listeria]|uniref:PadR family transcriptional regulator n=1 Tax=Listeria TaxID=1637 RepID=UPI000B595712|nr:MULTISPECIES: helix-turn-helix transcriptional regulator [Listeria]